MRVSFAGELGWEIHRRTEDTPAVWDIVMRGGQGHGLRPFGMFALNSPARRKGLPRVEGRPFDRLHDPARRAGAVRRLGEADDFRGKAALAAEKQAGVTKRFVALTVGRGRLRPALHVHDLAERHGGGRDDQRLLGPPGGGAAWRLGCCAPIWRCRARRWRSRSSAPATRRWCRAMAPLWDPKNERIRA